MTSVEKGETVPEFELPNVGVGPDPLSLADIVSNADFAVLLFLRDYHCPKCKAQVEEISVAAQTFSERNATVVPILPESRERAEKWRDGFDREFPFPLLADDEKRVAEQYDQPTRYGPVGSLHDMIGRLPESVVLDTRGDEATVVFAHRGESIDDRPDVDRLVDEIEEIQTSFAFDCSIVDC